MTAPSRSRAAALLYLAGGVTLEAAGAQFGISRMAVHDALVRIRRAGQRLVWPEDELTC